MVLLLRGPDEGRKETVVLHQMAMTSDWASDKEAHPIQFGWEKGGLPDGSKTPIQIGFGGGMGMDHPSPSPIQTRFGWACPP